MLSFFTCYMRRKTKNKKLSLFSLLLLVVLTYPFISIADKSAFIFGIPVLYFYLFSIWLIAVIIIRQLADTKNKNNDE